MRTWCIIYDAGPVSDHPHTMSSTEQYRVVTEDNVTVFISSNCKTFTSENRFPKSTALAELRAKLELITGASAVGMKISVFDKEDKKARNKDEKDTRKNTKKKKKKKKENHEKKMKKTMMMMG